MMKVEIIKKRTLFGKRKKVHIVLETNGDLCTAWHLFNQSQLSFSQKLEEEGNPLKHGMYHFGVWDKINDLVHEAGLKKNQL